MRVFGLRSIACLGHPISRPWQTGQELLVQIVAQIRNLYESLRKFKGGSSTGVCAVNDSEHWETSIRRIEEVSVAPRHRCGVRESEKATARFCANISSRNLSRDLLALTYVCYVQYVVSYSTAKNIQQSKTSILSGRVLSAFSVRNSHCFTDRAFLPSHGFPSKVWIRRLKS